MLIGVLRIRVYFFNGSRIRLCGYRRESDGGNRRQRIDIGYPNEGVEKDNCSGEYKQQRDDTGV